MIQRLLNGCTGPLLAAMALLMAGAAAAATYHVSIEGDDTQPGTASQPFRTIQHAADTMKPGDTCLVHEGVYRETVLVRESGTAGNPIRFEAAPGEEVILKGTQPIEGPWETHQGQIFKTQTALDFPQLFINGRMMVEARWPNLSFPDDLWDRSKWARAGEGSRYGKMVDSNLAATGIDWTGGYAILNVAHQFFSWTRTVKKHGAGEALFEYERDLEGITHFADKTKPWEDDFYYLAGKLEGLDAPGEWFLDKKTGTLYLWPPDGRKPEQHAVEVKTRNYAFQVKNCDHIELAGFQFFGATFLIQDCSHSLVEDCQFMFPTFTRRIDDPASEESWTSRTLVSGSHNTVRRCSLAYSPASGLAMIGKHNLAEDNLIHDISWYGCLRHAPLTMSSGDPNVFSKEEAEASAPAEFEGAIRRNTVRDFGNAGICFYGQSHLVELNHVYNGGLCCEDVSLVYTHLPSCAGTTIRYNWVHGCRTGTGRGLGIRGDDQTRHLTVHHNVVWDCGMCGIIVKGDFNKVYNNTVFDIGTQAKPGCAISMHTRDEPKKPWRKQWPLLEKQNANSLIFNNAAPSITGDNQGTPFPWADNLANNLQVADFALMDPAGLDFRPRQDSPLVDAGCVREGLPGDFKGQAPDIGAYEWGEKPWQPGATHH